MGMNYQDAGVDVKKNDSFVKWLETTSSENSNIVRDKGDFASICRLPIGGMKSPCLVTSTDGVGTKIKLHLKFETYDFMAQDLVAMCVNDLMTCGAQPLYFLDYYSSSKTELEILKPFVDGLRKSCALSGCDLVGGETAEMPGMYAEGDVDCAGFAVGVVEESLILGPHKVNSEDCIIGLSSSGFHSNGYSLVRKLFEKDIENWKDELLKPTHIYWDIVSEIRLEGSISAMAHITGGGINNISRIIPEGLVAEIENWNWPPLFVEAKKRSKMSDSEMLETFNCGIGFVVICKKAFESNLQKKASQLGYDVKKLGVVKKTTNSNKTLVKGVQ